MTGPTSDPTPGPASSDPKPAQDSTAVPPGASPPAAGGSAPQIAGSQAARENGLVFLTRLSATIRVSRSYGAENQVLIRQLEGLKDLVAPLLEESGEAVMVALEDDLYLNGVRVPVRNRNVRFHRHVLQEFVRRRIAGIRMSRGVTARELGVFFSMFNQPDVYSGTELLSACLAHGADHALPVIHASTDVPDDNFEYDAAWIPGDSMLSGSGEEPAADPGGGTGGTASAAYTAPRGAAKKGFSTAVEGARSLLTTTSLQNGMELKHAKRVVQPLVDQAFSNEPVVVGLTSLTRRDEYTYAHAVNVCLVAVTMGHYLEFDRRALADLGVASLLHDVGKAKVGPLIKHSLESFTPEEKELAERHPVEGAKLLARTTQLNQTTLRCIRVALEHHLGPSGDGYPAIGIPWRTSMLSRIISVADCYVSLQTHRSARGALVTPYEALGMMLGPLKSRFHAAMLWALVQTVGFYPPGQLVELDDGTIAAVLAPNPEDLARPHLRVLISLSGERVPPEQAIEHRPLPADRTIRRALRGEEYPQDPGSEDAAA